MSYHPINVFKLVKQFLDKLLNTLTHTHFSSHTLSTRFTGVNLHSNGQKSIGWL